MATESMWAIMSEYTPGLVSVLVLILLLEQISYLRKKRSIPGPTIVLPFIGNAVSLVTNPTKFWIHQSSLAKSTPLGISTNYVAGRFILYIYSTELSHKVFANIRPDAFEFIVHPFGKKLFGDDNLTAMFGQQHKHARRLFAPNFSSKALAAYTKIQQRIILKHLKSWFQNSNKNQSVPLRLLCRDLNLETSQTVFVGPYLSEEARERFNVDYNLFNIGLLKLPIDLPGFAYRKARLAVQRLVKILAVCAQESDKKMQNGDEPTCLIDFLVKELIRERAETAEKKGLDIDKAPNNYGHTELASYLFDFLFAAQDASTSSLLWAVTLLDSHPDVLQRMRLEVEKYWDPESEEPITAEQLREMRFTEAVAREVLRIRAPATMVPHITREDFRLTEDYVIPKGAVVFPSVFDSSFQGFTEPDRFDPNRFMAERQEDRVYKKNFLVFGAGPHQCAGQRYAVNQLKLFIAMFASVVDFKRARTDGCDDLAYAPTIVPKDDCRVFLSQRFKRFPSPS